MSDEAAAHYAAHEEYFRREAWGLIAPGFTPLDDVLEGLIELVEYDDDNPMTVARAEQIVRHYWAHRQGELDAPGPRTPSDDERLTNAFNRLKLQGIVAEMNIGFDKGEASTACEEIIAETGSGPGFVFFHGQDAAGLAYLSVLHPEPGSELVQDLRRRFGGAVILNNGFTTPTTRDEARGLVNDGLADAVVVGRALLANPDLVHRWRNEETLNEPDAKTFYASGAKGYTDYPTL